MLAWLFYGGLAVAGVMIAWGLYDQWQTKRRDKYHDANREPLKPR